MYIREPFQTRSSLLVRYVLLVESRWMKGDLGKQQCIHCMWSSAVCKYGCSSGEVRRGGGIGTIGLNCVISWKLWYHCGNRREVLCLQVCWQQQNWSGCSSHASFRRLSRCETFLGLAFKKVVSIFGDGVQVWQYRFFLRVWEFERWLHPSGRESAGGLHVSDGRVWVRTDARGRDGGVRGWGSEGEM